jgi:hypothetical protein
MQISGGIVMYGEQRCFIRNDLPKNAQQLIEYFGLSHEAEVPVASFSITVDGNCEKTEVREGKYKSALFLLYLAHQTIDGAMNRPFQLRANMRQIVSDYFGDALCEDATKNPETKHTTIRALLTENVVVNILIEIEPNH